MFRATGWMWRGPHGFIRSEFCGGKHLKPKCRKCILNILIDYHLVLFAVEDISACSVNNPWVRTANVSINVSPRLKYEGAAASKNTYFIFARCLWKICTLSSLTGETKTNKKIYRGSTQDWKWKAQNMKLNYWSMNGRLAHGCLFSYCESCQ